MLSLSYPGYPELCSLCSPSASEQCCEAKFYSSPYFELWYYIVLLWYYIELLWYYIVLLWYYIVLCLFIILRKIRSEKNLLRKFFKEVPITKKTKDPRFDTGLGKLKKTLFSFVALQRAELKLICLEHLYPSLLSSNVFLNCLCCRL